MIEVRLFGSPYVIMDNNKIKFPFMKAEALFYYLIYNKRATRDELVALFWSDNDEKNAKKNLRNAIYKLKKAFDMDIMISPQKSTVYINEDIQIKIDIDCFLDDCEDSYELYKGEFLKGFIVKNAEEFNKWASNKRVELHEKYIAKLNMLLDKYFDDDDLKNAEKVLKLLIKEDEFEEMNYRLLITLYKNQGSYLKALELYEKLKSKLKDNLGIEPSDETQKLMSKIPVLKKSKGPAEEDIFLGRYSELGTLFEGYLNYSSKADNGFYLIRGEAGIGKTTLKNQFLKKVKEEEILILETHCYQDEYNYFFKPWNTIFNTLTNFIDDNNIAIPSSWRKVVGRLFPSFIGETSDEINQVNDIDIVKFEIIENTICRIFERILKHKKIILIFEDIHWMNETSMKLLLALLHNENIFFLGTSRNERTKSITSLRTAFANTGKLYIMNLYRFNDSEINDFIDVYAKKKLSHDDRKTIQKETEGNPFYLKEYLDIYNDKGEVISGLSSKMENVIASKFMALSDIQKRITEIISIFFNKAPLSIIAKLLNEDELTMLDEIEKLSRLNIVNEIISDDIGYSFSHIKLREYVYNNQITAKKRLLHNKVGYYIEEEIKKARRSNDGYTDLIYHYTNANNHKKRVEYIIKYLDAYMYIQDELYPVNNLSINYDVFKLDRQDLLDYFEEIDVTLDKISDEGDKELRELKIMYQHLKGRYLIKIGKYSEGLDIIREMITESLKVSNFEYAIKGYRQKIYYAVQVNDLEFMKSNINAALMVAEGQEFVEDKAILLRLRGLYHLLHKDYEASEEDLRHAIKLFESIGDGYKLNVAACYNYIGGIKRYQQSYDEALKYYEKAMDICKSNGIIRGLTIFNTNAGIASYDLGDIESAKKYFNSAIRIYDKFDILWRRSIAEAYLGLLEVDDNNINEGFEHMDRAISYMNTIKNPIEILTIEKIVRILKSSNANNSNVLNRVNELLNNFNI